MSKEDRFMKDFNGDKVFSLEYDKETLRDMVLEKQEEIERLNNRLNKAIELLEKYNDNESNYYVPVDIVIKILQGSDKE